MLLFAFFLRSKFITNRIIASLLCCIIATQKPIFGVFLCSYRHTYKQKIDVLKQEKTSLEHRFNLVQSDFKSEQQRNATLKKRLDNSEKQLLEVIY